MKYCPILHLEISEEECDACEMCPDEEENDASPDYPLGGSVEPYDIERDKELTD